MCGIAGILTAGGDVPDVDVRVRRMRRALAHRGPDDSGDWRSADGRASFGHTRLAVIDLTAAGHQPMSVDDGRLTLVMNGQIYNFVELRRELQQQGIVFRSRGDAEVVLRAYDAWGDACAERLRGMFAFAIWDEPNRRCLVARDRFGIKPLYYAEQGGSLIFASELRAMLASGLVTPDIDARAAYEYFRAGSVQEPRTLIAGVRALGAGCVATWRQGEWRAHPYWDFSFSANVPAADAVAATRAALVDSVQHHVISDVPMGVFLSGGVDSTALLALTVQAGREDVRALTMSLPGTDGDERRLAERTARHFGVPHEVCAIDAQAGRALFEESLRKMDQPSIDGMNTLAVSQLARASGIKVVLSGLGADELFGGYPAIRGIPRLHAWHRRLSQPPIVRRAAGAAIATLPDGRCRRVGDLLAQPPALAASYSAYRGIFTRSEARLLTGEFLGAAPGDDPLEETHEDDPTLQDATCRLELTRYMRNQLLRDTDAMGMACGVEIRVPYLDAMVVDTVTHIDQRRRLRAGKELLHAAVPELPAWIARQPKRGFMFPIDAWLHEAWSGVFDAGAARGLVAAGPWYRQACIRAFTEFVGRVRHDGARAESGPLPVTIEVGR